jgi:hypothetical protein
MWPKESAIILQCCGSEILIPDPNFVHTGSRIQGVKKISGSRIRIRIKEFECFNQKNYFLALGNMIRDVHFGSGS